MEELYSVQNSILLDIQGLRSDLANLEEKKLNVKLLEEKLGKLEELFSSFKQNDYKIRSKYGRETSCNATYIEARKPVFGLYAITKVGLTGIRNYLQSEEEGAEEYNELTRQCILKIFDDQSDNPKDINNDQMNIYRTLPIMSSLERSVDETILENQTTEYYEIEIEHIHKKWEQFQQQYMEVYCEIKDSKEYGYNSDKIAEMEKKVKNVLIKLKEELNMSRNQHIINSLERIVNETKIKNQTTEYYEVKIEHINEKLEIFQKQNMENYCKIIDPNKAGYGLEKIAEIENNVQDVLIKLKEELNKSRDQHFMYPLKTIMYSLEEIVHETHGRQAEYCEVKIENIGKKLEIFQKLNMEIFCKLKDPDKAGYNYKKIAEIENNAEHVLIELKRKLKHLSSR